MSKENILRVHFNNNEPNVAEMTEILPKVGFRPLSNATAEELRPGAVVIIYNSYHHTFNSIVICEHHHAGFSYMLYNDLNNSPDIEFMDSKYHFKNRLYKVLLQLPEVEPNPSKELLMKALTEIGFKPLTEATSDDLPDGCIAILFGSSCTFTPVIVRTLSMSNRRLLYLHQSTIVAGDWHSAVIMDHLNPFEKYHYLVIS